MIFRIIIGTRYICCVFFVAVYFYTTLTFIFVSSILISDIASIGLKAGHSDEDPRHNIWKLKKAIKYFGNEKKLSIFGPILDTSGLS